METVALFGGSFDPPHIGHTSIVNALLELEEIKDVVVMPTYLNPFKSNSLAPSKLRFKWLKKIFKDYNRVEISDFEVNQNKKVPTIESVLHLLKRYQKVYLVIGADNVASLDKWYRYDELKDNVTFIVASRDGIDIPKHFLKIDVQVDISSTKLREDIDKEMLSNECSEEIYDYYKKVENEK
ncbi:MAG: nicotinate (nicotinamide) nucleotide adenylyltransferase [Campylobacterales bacterium]|nr:nicotinate (nicotinamide) nucleotide adenylyltransferase [Campylobacterales bacterium]